MEALGVYRESVYSPGRKSDDAMILQATATELVRRGMRVCLHYPHEINQLVVPPDVVFTMAQGETGLAALQRWQEQGTPMVNTTMAIRNCRRARTVTLCAAAGVPTPQSWLVATASAIPFSPSSLLNFSQGYWVKRADVHATHPDDVVQVWDETAMRSTLEGFAQRGITHALIQVHCPGTVVKFYGVGPGRFFDCPDLDPVTHEKVACLTTAAARALGLEVFGGDCILTLDGTLTLIDLNDWPSFARCREAAARAIADHLGQRIQRVM